MIVGYNLVVIYGLTVVKYFNLILQNFSGKYRNIHNVKFQHFKISFYSENMLLSI